MGSKYLEIAAQFIYHQKKQNNMEKINKTARRLLSASALGITFSYADGHRYIEFNEECAVCDNTSMYKMLEKNKIYPDTKVYGNTIDCLNYIDFLLKKMEYSTLEESFDAFNNWGFDDEFVGEHTPWEESGTETNEYFEENTQFE